jgi:hypothetical protein
MKRLFLAIFAAAAAYAIAGPPVPGTGRPGGNPAGFPQPPDASVKDKSQHGQGPRATPTPSTKVIKISEVSDYVIKISDDGEKFRLHFDSSLPVLRVDLYSLNTKVKYSSQVLESAIEFDVEVPYSMSPGILLKIDVNMGYFDDKQVTKLSQIELKGISTEPEQEKEGAAKDKGK